MVFNIDCQKELHKSLAIDNIYIAKILYDDYMINTITIGVIKVYTDNYFLIRMLTDSIRFSESNLEISPLI